MDSVRADLVFLQEVLGRHEKHDRRIGGRTMLSQLEYLAGRIWPHMAYGKNAVYAAGHHGNAILSKYPIIRMDNLDVSTGRMQKRGILHACVAIPGRKEPLHAVCLHLDLFEAGRRLQVDTLCRRIKSAVPPGAPLIVAGDFNDWRGLVSSVLADRLHLGEVHQSVHGEHARTFPSLRPVLRLDRIYVRGLKIRKAAVLNKGLWGRLSDHAALFSELAF
jgi:endonuclease/exonuclease/phosphatase family metal-dependent hydrolase